jgi:hypothetical protein
MKFCPECGFKLDRGTEKFCPECGFKLSAEGLINIDQARGDVFGVGVQGQNVIAKEYLDKRKIENIASKVDNSSLEESSMSSISSPFLWKTSDKNNKTKRKRKK